MEDKQRNMQYNRYVNSKIPKTHPWPTLFYSFIVGGLICVLGQGIYDIIMVLFPYMSQACAWAITLIVLIFLASFLRKENFKFLSGIIIIF